jgi:hypothetical protein
VAEALTDLGRVRYVQNDLEVAKRLLTDSLEIRRESVTESVRPTT